MTHRYNPHDDTLTCSTCRRHLPVECYDTDPGGLRNCDSSCKQCRRFLKLIVRHAKRTGEDHLTLRRHAVSAIRVQQWDDSRDAEAHVG